MTTRILTLGCSSLQLSLLFGFLMNTLIYAQLPIGSVMSVVALVLSGEIKVFTLFVMALCWTY